MENRSHNVWVAAALCATLTFAQAQSTINYSAAPGERDVRYNNVPVPNGNQVQVGYFDSGFDVLGNAGNIFALASAWHELAFTNVATIFGQQGRFSSSATSSDPSFDGQKICLWLFKTSDNSSPLPNYANVEGFGVFSGSSASWIFPPHDALPGTSTAVTSSTVDQAFHGDYNLNSLLLNPVPEPGTVALLGLGGAVLVVSRWKLRRRK